MTTRRPFSLLSATLCGLALGASVLLAGCGGGGSSSNDNNNGGGTGGGGGSASLAPGSYQGVSLNTSGIYSPAAGTTTFTLTSSGTITGATVNSDSTVTNFSGTLSSSGALVTNAATGNISQDATTHVVSTSYTEDNGTKGILKVGLAPTASPLAGSYSGTAMSSKGASYPFTLSITSAGAVTGKLGTPVAGNPNSGFTLTGYVDASGNAYLAFTSGGVPAISLAGLTLNGTALTGTDQETDADGSTNGSTQSATLSLTKQ